MFPSAINSQISWESRGIIEIYLFHGPSFAFYAFVWCVSHLTSNGYIPIVLKTVQLTFKSSHRPPNYCIGPCSQEPSLSIIHKATHKYLTWFPKYDHVLLFWRLLLQCPIHEPLVGHTHHIPIVLLHVIIGHKPRKFMKSRDIIEIHHFHVPSLPFYRFVWSLSHLKTIPSTFPSSSKLFSWSSKLPIGHLSELLYEFSRGSFLKI